MSSCAASSSTCSHAASCGSATSVSSPTANGLCSCHSASAYSTLPSYSRSQIQRNPQNIPAPSRSGTALCAEEACASSNGSPQLNSYSVPHHSPSSTPHERTPPLATRLRTPERTQSLRRITLQHRSAAPLYPQPDTTASHFATRSPPAISIHTPH